MALRKGYSPIGLDLGETGAKMVQLRAGGRGEWKLHAAGRVTCPSCGEDNSEQDGHAHLSAITRMLEEQHFAGRNVATVLRRTDVLIRPIHLPATIDENDKEAVWSAVQEEARRYLPYPPENAVLDFLTVGKVRDEEEEKLEVLLISAPKEKVGEHISLLESAGLRCVCIDIVPCSVLRTAEHMLRDNRDEVVVTVEMGERDTIVSVSRSGQLLFSRSVKTGGGTLTDAICEKLGLTRERAEMFKRNHGIDHRRTVSADFSDGTRISPKDMPAVLYELCQEELSHIASEVKRSVEYFVAQFSGAKVDRGLLFGGGANLKGLPDFLHDRTGLEVQVGDPFMSVNTDNGDLEERLGGNWASFAVALGLALRRG